MPYYYWLVALKNSLILVFGSCLVALAVGFFTSICAWRSGHVLGRLLPLLILGVPPYLLVFCLSEVVGYLDPWLPAMAVIGICNSAFIHAPLTSYLSRQGEALFESTYVATGNRFFAMFCALKPAMKAALPMGLTIVACEALSDLAVSRYYGIQSIVIMTFNAWASNLSLTRIVPGLVMMIVLGSSLSFFGKRTKDLPCVTKELEKKPIYAVFACLPAFSVIIFCLGTFVMWIHQGSTHDYLAIWDSLKNSLQLICFAVSGGSIIAFLMVRFRSQRFLVRTCLFLYSIPGLVLAAIMLPLGQWMSYFVVLNIAIVTRFSCLIVVNMDSIMQAHRNLNEMLLASCPCSKVLKQRVGLYSPAIVTGLCLIALDVLRELPMSRMLQPFNFTTLAMRISYLSATEMLGSMAVEAIILFAMGIFLTLIMIRVQYAFSK